MKSAFSNRMKVHQNMQLKDPRVTYQSRQILRPTPNSVRWDEVNQVKYRFQALHFQSDALDALIWNSPPLSRKERKDIIKKRENSNSSNKFEDSTGKQSNLLRRHDSGDYSSDYHSDDDVSSRSRSFDKSKSESDSSLHTCLENNDKAYTKEELLLKNRNELMKIIQNLQTELHKSTENLNNDEAKPKSKVAEIVKNFEKR